MTQVTKMQPKKIQLKWVLVFLCSSLHACLEAPSFMKQGGGASLSHTLQEAKIISVTQDSAGNIRATLDPTSKLTQTIEAAAGTAVAGTAVSFPPGALAIATEVTLSEGAPIAESVGQKLGLDTASIEGSGTPVNMASSEPIDAATPFTVSLKLPGSSLRLMASSAAYAVIYRVLKASTCETIEGVIASADLKIENDKASFPMSYFGTYQVVRLSTTLASAPAPVVSAAETCKTTVDSLPLNLISLKPYVAPKGATVEVYGSNLRPGLKFAFGSVPVSNMKLKSDTVATFVMPDEVPFGYTTLKAQQSGQEKTLRLFAQADKAGLPLITVDAAGVCAGVQYYDANGDKQTGTQSCKSSASGSGDMSKSVYDKNGDGIVDMAGSEGSDVTVGTTIVLPANGSFYRVVGNSANTTGIAPAPVGTRVTLMFTGVVDLIPTVGGSGLMMNRNKGYKTRPNDVFEFVSIGLGLWREVSRSVGATRVVARVATGQSVPHGSSGLALIADQELMDAMGEYNPATGVFIPQENGTYLIKVNMRLTNTSFPSPSCSGSISTYGAIWDNGSQVQNISIPYPCSAGYRDLVGQYTLPMLAGHSYTVIVNYNDYSTFTTSTLAVSGADALIIERAD